MAGVDYESILCVKPTVHVFRIPPRPSNRGYRAADWELDNPAFTGRMRVVAKGKDLSIKIEDKNSGELFARCPVEQYPGIAVESVTDSSRYFVIRIMDDNGRYAFIGMGFEDRGDSFDLNVALQDHFKHVKQEKEAQKAGEELKKGPKLDLGFKEGQTIRINISTKKGTEHEGESSKKSRPKVSGAGGLGLLPPPPGGVKLPPPGGAIGTAPSQSIPQQRAVPSPQSFNQQVPGSSATSAFATDFNATSSSNFNSGPTQASNNAGGASSNVDLLLDLGGDVFNSSQGQGHSMTLSGQGQAQSSASQGQSSLFDPSFDLLAGTSDAAVKPMAGSTDPWGDFTSASSSSSNSKEDADWVQF